MAVYVGKFADCGQNDRFSEWQLGKMQLDKKLAIWQLILLFADIQKVCRLLYMVRFCQILLRISYVLGLDNDHGRHTGLKPLGPKLHVSPFRQ